MRKTKGSGSRSGKNWRRNLHQNRRSDVKFCSSFWRPIGSVGGQVGSEDSQSLNAGEGEATPARTLGQGVGEMGARRTTAWSDGEERDPFTTEQCHGPGQK